MRVISGLNYTEKLETMIQECIKNAQENPFESYFFIAENPLIVEKIFFKYTSYLVNIEVLSWYDFLKTLQIEVNSENYKVILDIFKKAIIENARGYDAKDDRLGNNPNQMNIQ